MLILILMSIKIKLIYYRLNDSGVLLMYKFRFNRILKKKFSNVSEDFFKQKNLIYLFIDKSLL